VNPTGTGLVYSTYLGGSGIDLGNGIAVDVARQRLRNRLCRSTDFPTTPGALPDGSCQQFRRLRDEGESDRDRLVYSTTRRERR